MNYQEYLKLDELLALQEPLAENPDHDEMLFIVIHQVYELWFKMILQETDLLNRSFRHGHGYKATDTLRRIRTVLKTMVAQVDILETMTPLGFGSFRDRLETASGFQSWQFRLFEFAWGQKNVKMMETFRHSDVIFQKLQRQFSQPSVYDCFLSFLSKKGCSIPEEVLQEIAGQPSEVNEVLCPILLNIYREKPELRQVCEALIDIDEGLQEWRYRHIKMVERTIGAKIGTGGSEGSEYLKKTLFKPFFPDLWKIRTQM